MVQANETEGKETLWQKFDNWVWYSRQSQFEFQVNQYVGCYKGRNEAGLRFRRILALAITLWMILPYYNDIVDVNSNPLKDIRFFTNWGRYFTWFALVAGSFVKPSEPEQNVNSPWKAWKWYTILFHIGLSMEMVIVPFYWVLLNNKSRYSSAIPTYKIILGIGDHTLMLVLLLLDFATNCVPLCYRHFIIYAAVNSIYMVVNFVVTKVTGKPIYTPLSWNSPLSYMMPLFILIGMILIILLLRKLTEIKLKKYDCEHFLTSLY